MSQKSKKRSNSSYIPYRSDDDDDDDINDDDSTTISEDGNYCDNCLYCGLCVNEGINKKCRKCTLCFMCRKKDTSKLLNHNMLSVQEKVIFDDLSKYTYFKKLKKNDQIRLIKSKRDAVSNGDETIPFEIKVLNMPLKASEKSALLCKCALFTRLTPTSSEYHKLFKYLNGLCMIPFGKYVDMPVKLVDGSDKICEFVANLRARLDLSIYGQDEAKLSLLQTVVQWITNPASSSNVIGLHGPPGIGKTSIIKDGLANAINKPFSLCALGGISDSSVLDGHSYTYEGSTWGRIAEILIESRVMNPIIFFDELDKISETTKGDEITGVLTHLIDPSQNSSFADKYFSGVSIDLSKALFIFSFNDEHKINYILKDRIKIIHMNGYNIEEKCAIVKNYILPRILTNVNYYDAMFPHETVEYIVRQFETEKGVRKLRDAFESIIMGLNLMKYNEPDEYARLYDGNKIIITPEIYCRFQSKKSHNNDIIRSMYI